MLADIRCRTKQARLGAAGYTLTRFPVFKLVEKKRGSKRVLATFSGDNRHGSTYNFYEDLEPELELLIVLSKEAWTRRLNHRTGPRKSGHGSINARNVGGGEIGHGGGD